MDYIPARSGKLAGPSVLGKAEDASKFIFHTLKRKEIAGLAPAR